VTRAPDGQDPQRDLPELRQKVRDLDEQILKLMAERIAVARQIGRVKLAARLPIKDYKVEKEVIERSRAKARELGLYEGLAEDVSRLLIRYAVAAQDEFQKQHHSSAQAKAQRILIVGGRGRMGRWLSEFFDSFGHAVSHCDPGATAGGPYPNVPDLGAAALTHDVVVLAAPISATGALIDTLAASGTRALVFDICSLKTPFLDRLEAAARAGLKVASAHPMFGPSADVLAGRNILVCHVEDAGATAATRALFAGTTANVLDLPVRRHDELMSYVLGLSHLVNLVFAQVLAESGLPFADLARAASTTFNALLDVVRPVVGENQDLYYEIQAENAHTPELVRRLAQGLEAYATALQAGDRDGFKRLMDAGRRYLNSPSQN
jgi:chorismate mutase/prephenate dehydrogenase